MDKVEDKAQSRKSHEEKITVEKMTAHERQKVVYLLDLQGHSNKEISKRLCVSLSTVEKDLHGIREAGKAWFQSLTDNGMAKSMADACAQLDEAQKEMWRMYRSTDEKQTQIKILNSIANMSMKKKDLFWCSQDPYYHGYGLSTEDMIKRSVF